jgi:hypothetical protein
MRASISPPRRLRQAPPAKATVPNALIDPPCSEPTAQTSAPAGTGAEWSASGGAEGRGGQRTTWQGDGDATLVIQRFVGGDDQSRPPHESAGLRARTANGHHTRGRSTHEIGERIGQIL